jgi:hypothetical protein
MLSVLLCFLGRSLTHKVSTFWSVMWRLSLFPDCSEILANAYELPVPKFAYFTSHLTFHNLHFPHDVFKRSVIQLLDFDKP